MAAGRGTRVAHRVIADARMDDGWEEVAEGVDWVRREAELNDERANRDRWVEWFNNYYGEDAPVEADSERFQRVREAEIDDSLSSYVSLEEIDERAAAGQEALAPHLDVERLIAALDDETLMNHIDDELIRERARDLDMTEVNS
jgi:hypothetical protein